MRRGHCQKLLTSAMGRAYHSWKLLVRSALALADKPGCKMSDFCQAPCRSLRKEGRRTSSMQAAAQQRPSSSIVHTSQMKWHSPPMRSQPPFSTRSLTSAVESNSRTWQSAGGCHRQEATPGNLSHKLSVSAARCQYISRVLAQPSKPRNSNASEGSLKSVRFVGGGLGTHLPAAYDRGEHVLRTRSRGTRRREERSGRRMRVKYMMDMTPKMARNRAERERGAEKRGR